MTGVTTLAIAKVLPRDNRKIRGMLQPVSRDIRNVFSHNYRKLNDRQSMKIHRQLSFLKTQLASATARQICNMRNYFAKCCEK